MNSILMVMEQAVITAGQMLLRRRSTLLEAPAGKDLLTTGDRASHGAITAILNNNFPNIPIFSEEGEEGGYVPKPDDTHFRIDPVDGSKNEQAQDDYWGVSVALVERGATTAAVVYLPKKGQLFTASADEPTRMAKLPSGFKSTCTVSSHGLTKGSVWTDHWKGDPDRTLNIIRLLNEKLGYPQIRLCSTASMMAIVTGIIVGYIHPGPDPFDTPASSLILEKAAGKVTDIHGNPWGPFSEGIMVASNGFVHDALLELLAPLINP